MFDICGGGREGNAYLSDGVSIAPDCRLVDDLGRLREIPCALP